MELPDFFREHPKFAIAFSGGADSAYLLCAAIRGGAQTKAYFVKSAFQPQFELDDANRLARLLHADFEVIEVDVLSCDKIAANPVDRCYFCKKLIFSSILDKAAQDGFDTLLDGTNASDSSEDRPGMRVLSEMRVLSPLRLCGLTKDDIRRLSKEAGLFTWNKPAYACLATRLSAGDPITKDKLVRTERAEDFLFSIGFTDFRVRMQKNVALLQVPAAQIAEVLRRRADIVSELKKYYTDVTLDLEARGE